MVALWFGKEGIMATTQLFVELLIVGIGVAIWLAFLLAVVLRFPWGSPLPQLSTAHLTILLGTSYVLGILIDRLAWTLFHPMENRHRAKIFGSDPEPSIEDRERHILVNSSSLREQILYNRSRLRICRSWILNFAFIGIFSGIWAFQQRALPMLPFSIASVVLSLLTAMTTDTLAKDHNRNIRSSYDYLIHSKEKEMNA
jgi:hypothetical protein